MANSMSNNIGGGVASHGEASDDVILATLAAGSLASAKALGKARRLTGGVTVLDVVGGRTFVAREGMPLVCVLTPVTDAEKGNECNERAVTKACFLWADNGEEYSLGHMWWDSTASHRRILSDVRTAFPLVAWQVADEFETSDGMPISRFTLLGTALGTPTGYHPSHLEVYSGEVRPFTSMHGDARTALGVFTGQELASAVGKVRRMEGNVKGLRDLLGPAFQVFTPAGEFPILIASLAGGPEDIYLTWEWGASHVGAYRCTTWEADGVSGFSAHGHIGCTQPAGTLVNVANIMRDVLVVSAWRHADAVDVHRVDGVASLQGSEPLSSLDPDEMPDAADATVHALAELVPSDPAPAKTFITLSGFNASGAWQVSLAPWEFYEPLIHVFGLESD